MNENMQKISKEINTAMMPFEVKGVVHWFQITLAPRPKQKILLDYNYTAAFSKHFLKLV